ncbi:MAG: RNA polymerase sigma factor [Acidobacteria bacterium]|nr:RNA polymerase sigma factor [Acidobacteriota bacterium]
MISGNKPAFEVPCDGGEVVMVVMEKETDKRADIDILRLALDGDTGAFGELYDRWSGTVYRFALRLSGEPSIAEDATHDLFTTLMRDGHQYEGRGKFSSYLLSIVRRLVLHRLRRERRFSSIDEDESDFDQLPANPETDFGVDPLRELTRHEAIDRVRQAVRSLPLHYREVVLLCHLHEMSYAEAAEVIGCEIGTVCSRLYRARDLLARRLRDDAGPNAQSTRSESRK